MNRRARPAVLGRSLDHPRPAWVIFHIKQGDPQVRVRQHARMKSRLPQMTAPPLANVERLRVPSIGSPEQQSERILPLRHRAEVHMICHQAVSQNAHPVVGLILTNQLEIQQPVASRVKYPLPICPPLGDVIRKPWGDHSCIASILTYSCRELVKTFFGTPRTGTFERGCSGCPPRPPPYCPDFSHAVCIRVKHRGSAVAALSP
jgi:hypothetical protein